MICLKRLYLSAFAAKFGINKTDPKRWACRKEGAILWIHPMPVKEKQRYFAGFRGSNNLSR
jgi:hypothetical protein